MKCINDISFLHIFDNALKFCAAAIVNSNRQEEIVDVFIKHWIAIFGAPGVVVSNNGGEFNNASFGKMATQFNIYLKPTAPKSPWSYGMVERPNAIWQK